LHYYFVYYMSNHILYDRDNMKLEEFINVDTEDLDPIIPPYDLTKIRQTMDEFQRVANFVRSEDTDDWEEKIDKILWSPVQNRIFSRIVRILNSERVARLAKVNSFYEPILRRSSIDMTSKRFRETLASANWDWRISQWLHSLLFDYLPQEYLAIYLDILQTLRQKVPQLIDKMIAIQPNINSKGSSVTWETLGPLLKKSWDPVGPVLNASRPVIIIYIHE
jgi:regulatory NSL complex subunit 3